MKSLFPLLKFLDKEIEEYYKIIIFIPFLGEIFFCSLYMCEKKKKSLACIPFLGPHNMETISTSISSIAQSCQWVNYARHACNE